MRSISRFLSGYYICNTIAVLSWYFIRPYVDQKELLHADVFGVDMVRN